MISLADPLLIRLIADGADVPLADYLTERGATPADLAVLFAGTAPDHTGGVSQECLALWLTCRQEREQAEAVRALERSPEVFKTALLRDERFRRFSLNAAREGVLAGRFPPLNVEHPEVKASEARAVAVTLRDLKRRVLALPWAEGVRVERGVSVSRKLWKEAQLVEKLHWLPGLLSNPQGATEWGYLPAPIFLREKAIEARSCILSQLEGPLRLHEDIPIAARLDGQDFVFTQTLTAAQLIAPESGWRLPEATPDEMQEVLG